MNEKKEMKPLLLSEFAAMIVDAHGRPAVYDTLRRRKEAIKGERDIWGITREEYENAPESRYIMLPILVETLMVYGFLKTINDEYLRHTLDRAYDGRLAKESFNQAIREHKLFFQYYDYKKNEAAVLARQWCKENGIDYIEDMKQY